MTEKNNAIIVGAGHNGLACAAYLARAGYEVMVLEAGKEIGGAADTLEFSEGFRVSGCAQFVYQLRSDIVDELGLEEHGLSFVATGMKTVALSASGEHIRIRHNALQGPVSERDQAGFVEFDRLMRRFADLLATYMGRTPPLLVNNSTQDKLTLARLGFDIRRLGRDDMREFLRVVAINIYDVLNEFFDSELAKGALALDAVLGTHLGPRSPNTVLTYLHRLTGNTSGGTVAQPAGGMGSVTQAFAKAAIAAGAKIRTGVTVRDIIVEHGKVTGVRLENSEVIRSLTVVSNADPKTTILSLVGARHCETGFTRRIHNFRLRGNAARLYLALDGEPVFHGLESTDLGSRLVISPDMDYAERAFNPAKYGQCSAEPVLEVSVPSANDATLSPPGKHVLSATVQYAPYALKGGWTEGAKRQFLERVTTTLERYAPAIREQILASDLLTPTDIEQRYRICGGHWHHGELTLDQFLFARPVPGAAQYAMPVEGLYLCGAGAHPGGAITGAPGRNAAKVILAGGHSA